LRLRQRAEQKAHHRQRFHIIYSLALFEAVWGGVIGLLATDGRGFTRIKNQMLYPCESV